MRINTQNYYQYVNKVGVDNFTPGLRKMHDVIDKLTMGGSNWNQYVIYKDRIDKQFEALEMFMEEKAFQKPEHKHDQAVKKTEKQPVERSNAPVYTQPTHKATKSAIKKQISKKLHRKDDRRSNNKNYKKPSVKGKGVELISPEVGFIKRFVLLHNKTKTKEQILGFIRALQKAIIERRIRKTSKSSKMIENIQSQLVGIYKKMGQEIKLQFSESDLNKYYKIAGAEIVMPSVRFIKAYYNLQGKEANKHKASNLLNRIEKAINKDELNAEDKYFKYIRQIKHSLESFLKQQGKKVLNISEADLNGLEGVLKECGCHDIHGFEYEESDDEDLGVIQEPIVRSKTAGKKTPFKTVLNSEQVVNLKSDKLNFTGKWLSFIGNPSRGFTAMIYGKPKLGKSYLAIDFAGYLARNHGKVLYAAYEEGFDDTLQQKLKEKNVVHPNLFVSDYLPTNLKGYDFIFVDSVNRAGLNPEQIQELEIKNPNTSFIYVFQTTKDGNFRGANEHQHNVDVVITIPQKGLAVQNGRYNQGAEMKIF